MSVLQVLLEIPEDIAIGLANGTLVRDAAGVIRDLSGRIVAHLHEISSSEITGQLNDIKNILKAQTAQLANIEKTIGTLQSSVNMFGAMFLCVQIASTIYLGSKLDNIQNKLENIENGLRDLKSNIEELKDDHIIDVVKYVQRARENYVDARYENAIEDACRARSDIYNYINNKSAKVLLLNISALEKLFRYFFASFYIHMMSAQHSEQAKQRIPYTAKAYKELFINMYKKINLFPQKNINALPTSDVMKAIENFKKSDLIIEMRKKAPNMIEALDNEICYLESYEKFNKELTSITAGDIQKISQSGGYLFLPVN